MIGLTPKQLECFRFISTSIRETGISPTFGEICTEMGTSSRSSAHRLVHALIERGYIRQRNGMKRSIELVAQAEPVTLRADVIQLAEQAAARQGVKRDTLIAEAVRAYCEGAA